MPLPGVTPMTTPVGFFSDQRTAPSLPRRGHEGSGRGPSPLREFGDLLDRRSERGRCLLWQVVAGVRHVVMRPGAGEVGGARRGIRRREVAVGEPIERHGRNGDRRQGRELLFEALVRGCAVDLTEAVPVGVDDDVDVVGVLEGLARPVERGVVEVPVGGVPAPDE